MNPAPVVSNGPEVRAARASSVIVQRIPAERTADFLEWQRGITSAATTFAGYQATEIYPPSEGTEWVIIVHFGNAQAIQGWLNSPARAEWMAKLPAEFRDFRVTTVGSGFGAWFAGSVEKGKPLPHWKMFLVVLFGLYPAVMVIQFVLGPHLKGLGLAGAMLVGNAASVSFLEWLGMPVLNRYLGPWLRANDPESRGFSIAGLVLLVAALALMTYLFGLANGKL